MLCLFLSQRNPFLPANRIRKGAALRVKSCTLDGMVTRRFTMRPSLGQESLKSKRAIDGEPIFHEILLIVGERELVGESKSYRI